MCYSDGLGIEEYDPSRTGSSRNIERIFKRTIKKIAKSLENNTRRSVVFKVRSLELCIKLIDLTNCLYNLKVIT